MRYFRSQDNQVFGYETDGTQNQLITDAESFTLAQEWCEMTTEQARIYLESLRQNSVPSVVSKVQAVLSLSRAGIWPAFNAYLNADDTSDEHKLAWENLSEVHRDSEMLAEIAGALELSDDQVNALFVSASQIKA